MRFGIDDVVRHRVIPVVVIDDPAGAQPLAAALVRGGLPVAEVTLRTPAALTALTEMAAYSDVLVGAGTVLTADQVDAAVAAGARFVVSPGLSRAVVERCAHHGVPVLPGVQTPTEVMAALELGCDVVKFFPAGSAGGVAAVRALAGPFPGVGFVPTGGIDASRVGEYLAEPAVRAVGGSWMVDRRLVATGDVDALTAAVATAVSAVAAVAR